MKVIQRNIDDLIHAEYNPREMTADQYEHLKSSLLRFGFVDPVIVNTHPDRKDIVVGGHQRLKVWRELGKKKVPTVTVNLDLALERELNIRLNKNVGQWDWDALSNDFEIEDLTDWGFKDDELTEQFWRDSEQAKLIDHSTKQPPKMAWTLIGVPIHEMHKIADALNAIRQSQTEEDFFETSYGDQTG